MTRTHHLTVEAPASHNLTDGPVTPAVPRGGDAITRFVDALTASVSAMSVNDVRSQMRLARSVKAIVEARLIELNQRMTQLAIEPGSACAVDPRRELRAHGGLRGRDARAVEVQTAAVVAAPAIGDLLAAGATTSGHVEALGHALVAAGEGREILLDQVHKIASSAVTMAVDDFDRFVKRLARDAQPDDGLAFFEHQRRSTQLKVWNDRDGMVRLSGAFDPERGAAIAGCLDRHVEAMFHSGDRETPVEVAPGIDPNDHRRAVAFHALCTRQPGQAMGAHESMDTRPARAEVVVHVDLTTLRDGLHLGSVCRTSQGSDIPPATARRLACDADIIPVVLSGAAVPLDVGRAKRLATVHQRRALEAHHTHCAIDDCDTPFSRCVIHHITPWEHGGPTTLDNLVPLCNRHHHAVHEGGWTISLSPATRHLTVTLPNQRAPDST